MVRRHSGIRPRGSEGASRSAGFEPGLPGITQAAKESRNAPNFSLSPKMIYMVKMMGLRAVFCLLARLTKSCPSLEKLDMCRELLQDYLFAVTFGSLSPLPVLPSQGIWAPPPVEYEQYSGCVQVPEARDGGGGAYMVGEAHNSLQSCRVQSRGDES